MAAALLQIRGAVAGNSDSDSDDEVDDDEWD
jgi:hypothetical protein